MASGQSAIGALPVDLPSLSTGTSYNAMNAARSAALVMLVSIAAQAVLTASRQTAQAAQPLELLLFRWQQSLAL